MQLAVNYSPQAAHLVAAGTIPTDLFKCPEWPDLVAEAQTLRPVHVHFGLRAAPGNLDGVDWALVEDLLSRTATRYVNLHLYPQVGSFPGIAADAEDRASVETVTEGMLSIAADLARRFGPQRVIVENMPHWGDQPDDVLRPAVLPEVIRRVVAQTGCGFLLDIAHARIAARALGTDEREYIAALPIKEIREMHVAGLGILGGRLRDHQELTAEDWAAFEWALRQIRDGQWREPWLVTFEYGGVRLPPPWPSEQSVLAEQMPRIYRLVHPSP